MGTRRVLMLLQSDFPPDMRVEKEALSLLARGYRVWILADNRSGRREYELYKGIDVHRLPRNVLGNSRLTKLLRTPAYPNPLWLARGLSLIRSFDIEILHAHDLPMAPFGVHLSRTARLPLVLDFHENYPAAMKRWWRPGISGLTVRNPFLARWVEKAALKRADKILVVGAEHKELLSRQSVASEKIHVVENTPYRSLAKETPRIWPPGSQTYDMLYFGVLNPERGLELAVEAFPSIREKVPHARLVIIGDGPVRRAIERLVERRSLRNRVVLTGWLPLERAKPYFESARICIMPHESNEALDIGAPNKLFEYMAFGRPVVVPDAGAVGRIVRETGAGAVFKPGSAQDFARAVVSLVGREKEVGEKGRRAVLQKYNWEATEKELLRAYAEIGAGMGGRNLER